MTELGIANYIPKGEFNFGQTRSFKALVNFPKTNNSEGQGNHSGLIVYPARVVLTHQLQLQYFIYSQESSATTPLHSNTRVHLSMSY